MAKNSDTQRLDSDDPFADTGTTDIGSTGTDGVIDFSAIQSDLMPEHDTHVKCVKAELTKSKKGDPLINLRWRIEDGDFEGRLVFDSISFHPNSMVVAKGRLKKLGMPADYRANLQQLSLDLVGVTADAKIGIQKGGLGADGNEYEDRNKISGFRNAEGFAGGNSEMSASGAVEEPPF